MRSRNFGTSSAFAVAALTVALGATGPVASAQEPEAGGLAVPTDVEEAVLAFLNDPATIRFNGRSGVPEDGRIEGNVGVLGGPFTLDGTIDGSVVVLNGHLVLTGGGTITGDLTVVGGRIVDAENGTVGGTMSAYQQGIAVTERDGRIVRRTLGAQRPPGIRIGRSRLTVRSGGSYNRIEGLPVLFGPTLDTGGDQPFRAEALGLWRTESGFELDDDELGYRLSGEQQFGDRVHVGIGGSLYREVTPISEWGLTSLESSLSTFLFHKDFRDYYSREGWSLSARVEPTTFPFSLALRFRDEDHRFAPVSSPWSLRRNDDPWRSQPLVGEGDLQTLSLEGVYDTRNDREDPTDGWYVVGRVVRGLDGELSLPGVLDVGPEEPVPVDPVPVEENFTTAVLDLRRYNRVTPASDLSFRVLYGGTIAGDELPPQFQQALGGEGSLPGYKLFSIDCGARSEVRELEIERRAFDDDSQPTQPVFPHYGCDRAFLFQIAYRSDFALSLDLGGSQDVESDDDLAWYPVVDLTPSWSVFFNLGEGWSERDEELDTGTFSDIGLGLFLGDLGVYLAHPLEGSGRGVNFFVRLSRRF